ncbi:hypothetical protein Tco_1413741, partial [Tanacetum coccineum]
KFYELDCITRKHLTVYLFYVSNPSSLSKRFPFIESLKLKYLPHVEFPLSTTPWIKEISVKFDCLKALYIRHMHVSDQDLDLLAKTRGKDLHTLKICTCTGFSEKGLLHISEYCNDLTSLCLEDNGVEDDNELVGKANGEWLRELALRNTSIESLHLRYDFDLYDVENFTVFAKKCSNSLVSLKISPKALNLLGDAFSQAIKLEDLDGVIFDKMGTILVSTRLRAEFTLSNNMSNSNLEV